MSTRCWITGNHRLELVDGRCDRGLLGFLLRLLAGERGDLGALLGSPG